MQKKPSLKLVLSKRAASDKEGYINIRISIPGTNKYKHKSIGEKIPVKFWDAKAEKVKPAYKNSDTINTVIYEEKTKIDREISKRHLSKLPFTPEYIDTLIHTSASGSVLEFYREYIEYVSRERKDGKKHSVNYIKALNTVHSKLEAYSGGNLHFSDITIGWLEKFEEHHAKLMNNKTTLPALMGRIRAILNMADNRGLFERKAIYGYKFPVYKHPTRPYLTLEETDLIADAIYKGKFDDTDPALKVVACFFLVECFSGIRFSDWGKYEIEKLIDSRSLRVRETTKTKQPIYLRMDKSPRLSRIVDYIIENKLKFTYTEQHTNRTLKIIQGILGISTPLTTHLGRHTCATLFLETGYSIETVAEILGVTIKTVEIYAKTTRRKINSEYDKLGGL